MAEMTTGQVCKTLQITAAKLKEWRDEGLPCKKVKGGKFAYDPHEVKDWLIANAKAVQDQAIATDGEILKTRQQVAVRFGVTVRTVGSWLEDPSFPGQAGKGRKADGYFPEFAIAKWISNTNKQARVPDDLAVAVAGAAASARTDRDRLTGIRADRAALELAKLQGEMIDAREAMRFYERTNAYAVSLLNGLPVRVIADLPSDVSDVLRRVIHRTATTVANEVKQMMAELLEGDQDDKQPPTKAQRTRVVS